MFDIHASNSKMVCGIAGHVAPVLDGLSATTMDESLLRKEPLLWRYWTAVSWLSYKQSRAAVTSRKSTLQVHLTHVDCFDAGVCNLIFDAHCRNIAHNAACCSICFDT